MLKLAFRISAVLASLTLPFGAHAAGPAGFAPADSFRTLNQIMPGKTAREKSITLRWAPVSCVNGYVVHLARTEDMAKPRITATGARNFLSFPTTFTGNFYWQVGCAGEQSAGDASVETHSLTVNDRYLPSVVPPALTRRVVRKAGSGDSIALGNTDPTYRHRLEVFSPKLELLNVRESSGDDAYWPSVGPGFYYYRIQSTNAEGVETYPTPLSVLQVEGRAGSGPAARGMPGARGIMVAAGAGVVGQTGTQVSQVINGDISSGTTAALNFRAQWNWSPRWAADVRLLTGSSTYNDAKSSYQEAKFSSLEWRAMAHTFLPSGDKFWLLGAGVGSRNHPFVQVNGFTLTIAPVRTLEAVLRGGVEWRPERWRHTVTLDLMAPVSYTVANVDSMKGSMSFSGEIELTSYYFFTPQFSVGGFIGGRISNTKFNYKIGLTTEDVQLKFSRVMGGVLGAYNF
ncbi:MAG: hypothetical protein EOP11_06960 [Proteobacteria bacterium]|nr:MAG: hypothetical protein EOP11_06960 [Pseudomonadota bacterium]